MRDNIEGAQIRDCVLGKGNRHELFELVVPAAPNPYLLPENLPEVLWLSAAAARVLRLPAAVRGARVTIVNTSAGAFGLTINDAAGALVMQVDQNETGYASSNGTVWKGTVGVA